MQEDPLLFRWIDVTTFETEFQLEVRFNGSGWMPYDQPVLSTTMHGTGKQYGVVTGPLPMNGVFMFRVRSYNRETGQTSEWSTRSNECYTPKAPSWQVGCYDGQVYMQGRSDHSDATVYYHGFPVTLADASGDFSICGALPGYHTIAAGATGYLETVAGRVYVGGGRTTTMPYTALRGGDVNNDATVNLYDLVRVGASYNTSPPLDPDADCNDDGRVDLLDLVMVGSNYGVSAPVPWAAPWPSASSTGFVGGAPLVNAFALPLSTHGAASGAPVDMPSRMLSEDTIEVDLVVQDAAELYGVDVVLAYDTDRLELVDQDDAEPGIQIRPGAMWTEHESFIARNASDTDRGEIRFAASLVRPEEPLAGTARVATVTFRVLDGDYADAYRLTNVRLSRSNGRPLGAKWSGVEIHRVADILLPIAHVVRGVH